MQRDALTAGVLGAVSFAVFLISPVRALTDSRYSLLVTESLLRSGGTTLDPFVERVEPARPDAPREGDYRLRSSSGHVRYAYPLGTAVLSLPLVVALRPFGYSVVDAGLRYDATGEARLQGLIAALLMGAFAAVAYLMARLVLPPRSAVTVALVGSFGTSIWSTASRCLWSDSWSVLLLSVAVLLMARHEIPGRRPQAALVATLLCWMYFVRPTAAVPLMVCGGYFATQGRRHALVYAIVCAVWLGSFVVHSLATVGTPLPEYYRQSLSLRFLPTGLLGLLVSPSRGLLVFSPVVAVVAYLLVRHRRGLRHRRLLLAGLAGFAGHLVASACFEQWWGGHSYGPRLLTGAIPWLILLAALALDARRGSAPPRSRKGASAFGIALAAISIVMHARGAFARATWDWNHVPTDVTATPSKLWSWRSPQFLAGIVPFPRPEHADYQPGTVIRFGAEMEPYLWEGWGRSESDRRWTIARRASLAFTVSRPRDLVLRAEAMPFLVAGRLDRQRVIVTLNGQRMSTLELTRPAWSEITVPLTGIEYDNELVFDLPDATSPHAVEAAADRRTLGFGLRWLSLADRETAPRATTRPP